MKKLIIGVIGIMVLISAGCSPSKTVPLAQPSEASEKPAANEMAMLWFERGKAFVQSGDYEDAVNDFTQAIESDPNFADAYYIRGRVQGRLGKHEQAVGDFTKAISLDPDNAGIYADRGVAYGFLGKQALAMSDFTQAITLNPNFADAYYNRAIGYLAEKKCAEAQKDIREAQRLGYPRIKPGFLENLKKVCPENE